jgi:hypothetical protein
MVRPSVNVRYRAAQSGRSYAIAPREFTDPEALDKGVCGVLALAAMTTRAGHTEQLWLIY